MTGTLYILETRIGVVWCDANSITIGSIEDIIGSVSEDAAWLQKKDDYNRINGAELEAVLKGVKLALKNGLRQMEVRTDATTVLSWVNSIVEESRRIRTKSAGGMIIKGGQLIAEFGFKMKAMLVPLEKNKADALM